MYYTQCFLQYEYFISDDVILFTHTLKEGQSQGEKEKETLEKCPSPVLSVCGCVCAKICANDK